jgi:hypothetical protein
MKRPLKDLFVALFALLLLALAVTAYLKALHIDKEERKTELFTLVPSGMKAALRINDAANFKRMFLIEPKLVKILSGEIPPVFLSILKTGNEPIETCLFSFHTQGVLCYIKTVQGSESMEKGILSRHFPLYKAQKLHSGGMDFFFYPDTGGRFFGYYVEGNVWIASYDLKLLRQAAARLHAGGTALLPAELAREVKSFDPNSSANLLYPAADLGLDGRWVAADLFINKGELCCYLRLPETEKDRTDQLAGHLDSLYPSLHFSFQNAFSSRDSIFVTGCSPL